MIRLFSLAFPDEWDYSAFYNSQGNLRPDWTQSVETASTARSWDIFPDALQRLAGSYELGERDLFVRDVGTLFHGAPTRFEEADNLAAVTSQQVRSHVFLSAGSFEQRLIGTDGDGNVHHWSACFMLGYFVGTREGMLANLGREYIQAGRNTEDVNFLADVTLGTLAIGMGGSLRSVNRGRFLFWEYGADWRESIPSLWVEWTK